MRKEKNMSTLYIVLSETQLFREGAELISEACERQKKSAKIITIDGVADCELSVLDKMFFLTNEDSVGKIAQELNSTGVEVLNSKYITCFRVKSEVQEFLSSAGVLVPKIYVKSSEYRKYPAVVREIRFPIYIKSENHVCDVLRVHEQGDFFTVIKDGGDAWGWYAEEAVDAPDRILRKVYWVSGKSFERDGEESPTKEMDMTLQAIGDKLSFDTFSADLIVGDGKLWCIDVNPAPALFGSVAARDYFAERFGVRI
jgi:hypothetical protein